MSGIDFASAINNLIQQVSRSPNVDAFYQTNIQKFHTERPTGTFLGFGAGDTSKMAIQTSPGQVEFLSRDQALARGFITPNDLDVTGVKRFTSFQSEFPAVVDVLNKNFDAIAKNFAAGTGGYVPYVPPGTSATVSSTAQQVTQTPKGNGFGETIKQGFAEFQSAVGPVGLIAVVGLAAFILLRR
jgi:hypothetical protein